ncbi:Rieske (2Fe-2S) protein, partial [Candidatus Poribacteria bacterium]|nr:Rieske (2Fe-2S) protein [Candidatus Poribacteria bacterium]
MSTNTHHDTPDSLFALSEPEGALDPGDLVYHPLCAASDFEEGEGKPFHIDGTHLAVFCEEGKFHAVDNRCPHMGYPMSEGSVRDGVLICHWHHWEFDLKTGGCFLAFGDDLKAFQTEVRDDGIVYVGLAAGEKEAARLRVIGRGQRQLVQGLKDRSPFLIAKAVAALQDAEAPAREIIHQGLFYGANKTNEGWSSGVAVLAIAANMWEDVDPADHNLFLVHGLTQTARRTTGASRRHRTAFPRSGDEHSPEQLERWFRYFVDKRDTGAAERVLLTMHDREFSKSDIARLIFTTATDYYFTGDGHALDFANKTFEALDYVEWQGAAEILRPIVVD